MEGVAPIFRPTPKLTRRPWLPAIASPAPLFLKPSLTPTHHPKLPIFFTSPSTPLHSTSRHHCHGILPSPSSLHPIMPFLLSQWPAVLKGWLCSAVAVACLSRSVPSVGAFSGLVAAADLPAVAQEGAALVALGLVRCSAGYLQQAFLWEAALGAACGIRVHVFGKVLERDLGFFEGGGGLSSGDVAYRITAEASDVADTVYAVLNTVVPNLLQFSAMATQMLLLSPALSLMTAMAIPCMSLIASYLGKRLRRASSKARLSAAKLSAYLNEVIPSILIVKANNCELSEKTRFHMFADSDLNCHIQKKRMKALIPQLVQVSCIGGLLVFCISSMVVTRGSMTSAKIISFLTSLFLVAQPVQGMGKAYNEWKEGEPAIERLFELTRFKLQVVERPDAIDLDCVFGDIKFSGITFNYGENMPHVLDGLDLHIKPGETIALVGPSGGGKTTLAKLLLRLYDPISGSILVDDYDIRTIHLTSLRRHISLVSQDIALFSGTVAENIGYRDFVGKIDMAKVKQAAKIANADEFIANLPNGYETNIGQRGTGLSGGQRQRLAIARALYHDPSILILDEATSALDSQSELLVRQALARLLENHTVLLIAHRLETILMADRILLLKDGKLEEISSSIFFEMGGRCNQLAGNRQADMVYL